MSVLQYFCISALVAGFDVVRTSASVVMNTSVAEVADQVSVRRTRTWSLEIAELALSGDEVRRQKKMFPNEPDAGMVESHPWEQLVRHENSARAKEDFESDLTDDLMHEVLIAMIGFSITLGLQRTFRLKNGRFVLRSPRRRALNVIARPTTPSKNAGVLLGAHNRIPQLKCNNHAAHKDGGDVKGMATTPCTQSHGGTATHDTAEKQGGWHKARTDADALKKISKWISSGEVADVAGFLLDSANNIERSRLPLAGFVTTTEALMILLRTCTTARLFKEAIAVYDCLERRIGSGSRHLWSLLLYIATEADAHTRCDEFYAKLYAEAGSEGPTGRDLVNIIRKHARYDDLTGLQAVLDGLNNFKSKDQYDRLVRNRALAACYREGATHMADCIANSPVFAVPLDNVGYNTLIACYARAGQYPKCFATFRDMEAKGVVPTQATFGSLIEACVGAQDWVRAKIFCDKIPNYGITINAQHCTILIKGLVKQNRLEDAEELLEKMTFIGVQLDVIAFYTLLRAYADLGNNEATQRVFSSMLRHGVQPDEYVCNALFHSCTIRTANTEYIKSILERSVVAGVKPSTTTLSLMLKAFALCDAFDAGLELLESAAERFGTSTVEPRLFVQLAQAAIKAGDKDKALEVHDAMVKGLNANGQKCNSSSRWLLRQCEKARIRTQTF